jgi:hypothetical protein
MFFSSTTYRPTDSGTHTAPYKSGKGPLSSEGSTTVCSAYLHLVTKLRIRETPYFRPLPKSSWCQRVSSLFLTRDKLRTFRQCEIFQQPKTSVTLLRSSITPSLKLDSKIWTFVAFANYEWHFCCIFHVYIIERKKKCSNYKLGLSIKCTSCCVFCRLRCI